MRQRRSPFRRWLALLLTAALCSSLLPLPAAARETHVFSQWPQGVPDEARSAWKDKDLAQILLTELSRQLEELLDFAGTGAPAAEVLALYEQAVAPIKEISTHYGFCCWAYSRQPQENAEDYSRWYNANLQGSNSITEAEQVLFSGPYQEAFREKLGDLYVDFTLNQPVFKEEQFVLQEQEQELIHEYNIRSAQVQTELTYEYNGTSYSLDSAARAYDSGELKEEEYLAVYGPLVKAANAQVGPLYLELVDVRNRFARSLGYDNYGEYAFPNLYGRDYSVEEGILYCQEALGNLGPLSARLNVVADPDIDPEGVNEVMSDLTGQEMVDLVRPNMEKVSGELAELFQYMLDNELLDTEPLDSKLFSAFTEALPAYDSAYLFFHPDYLDAYTLVHEFGHFADFCLAPDVIPCYDILEIHSQGLETLYFSFADELVGEENAASLRQYWLSALLDSGVVNGAVVAAFELEAYTKGDMTLEELNRYYGQLSEAAGFDTYYDDAAYGWYGIPHLFTSPCYYLSYSTSAASALDLLLLSQEDFVRAADVYLNLVAQRDVYGYRDAAEAVGLTNMLEPGALTDLAAGLEEYIYDQVWEVEPFSDVPENSWAYRDVMAAVAGGMLSAEKEGIFAPDRAMNGQELSAAMNWFATETGEEWSVASEDVVTREELILAVYHCARKGLDVSARADLSGYGDAGEISAEALDAISWAVAEGILSGTGKNILSPREKATRAQTAAVLMRFYEGPFLDWSIASEQEAPVQELYNQALKDAEAAEEAEILALVSLTREDPQVTWDQEGRVLLCTWHAYPESYPEGQDVTVRWGPVWTFTYNELAGYLEELEKAENPELRLRQLIGLRPDTDYDTFTAFWVDPKEVVRPAYQSDPERGDMTVSFGETVDPEFRAWFEENEAASYGADGYPWTRLGYTYDWADNGTEYGLTEFLVPSGTEVEVAFTDTTEEFLERMAEDAVWESKEAA